jgi:phasin family protein
MYTVPEQWIEANKETLESLITLNGILFVGAEKLIDLNLKTAKAAFADAAKTAKALSSVKDVQEFGDIQSSFVQPTTDKFVAYGRSVYSVATETQADLTKFFETRVAELNKSFVSALDKAAKSAPAGSDVAVAAVKSAVAAANQAYDVFTKASRQVVEATEATVNAAISSTGTTKKKAA